MAEEILSLNPLVPQPFVRISGARYDLRLSARFSLLEATRLDRLEKRLTVLKEKEETDENVLEMQDILDKTVRLILPAPDEVHLSLSDMDRMQIFNAFTALLQGKKAQPAGAKAVARQQKNGRRSTGASSSRG